MAVLQGRSCDFLPFSGRGEGIEIQEGTTIERGTRGSHDALQAQQGSLVHLIPGEQLVVISEVTKEPVQFPQGFRGGVEPPGKDLVGMFFGFEDCKAESKEGLL